MTTVLGQSMLMASPQQQMEDLLQAQRDMIEALEKERAKHHEAGARANDNIIRLQLGTRRP